MISREGREISDKIFSESVQRTKNVSKEKREYVITKAMMGLAMDNKDYENKFKNFSFDLNVKSLKDLLEEFAEYKKSERNREDYEHRFKELIELGVDLHGIPKQLNYMELQN